MRRSEDVLDVFWTSYIHSVYVLVYASVRCDISEKRYENIFMKFWEAITCICPIEKWLWKILQNLWGSTCDGVLLYYVDDTEISFHWFFFLACCSSMLNCFLNLKFKVLFMVSLLMVLSRTLTVFYLATTHRP